MNDWVIGVDLGQVQDYTAIAILHRVGDGYEVPHLERVALGTSYPDVVARVLAIHASPRLDGNKTVVVDATGVGAPVVDLLRPGLGRDLIAATITAGDRVHRGRHSARVPKRDLVSTVSVLLQTHRLHVAHALPAAAMLVEELLAFKVRISTSGHDSYGTPDWREKEHDDLVLAVALAAWHAELPQRRVRIIR